MSKVKILVEGIADAKFLQDIVAEWYNASLKISDLGKIGDIICLGGKDAFDSVAKLDKLAILFDQASFLNVPIVVIADADHYPANRQLFTAHRQIHDFQFFLLPNDADDGDLETLLQFITHPANQIVFDCWQAYENCLRDQTTTMTAYGTFTLPARKTKVYAYLEALVGETKSEKDKIKENNRDYRNKHHWNLDPDHLPLKPLKEFLDPFFSPQ